MSVCVCVCECVNVCVQESDTLKDNMTQCLKQYRYKEWKKGEVDMEWIPTGLSNRKKE